MIGEPGLSLWTVLTLSLRSSLERGALLSLAAFSLAVLNQRLASRGRRTVVDGRRFAVVVLGFQLAAAAISTLYIGWSLGWKIFPVNGVIESFAQSDWHVLLPSYFSVVALGLSVLYFVVSSEAKTELIKWRKPAAPSAPVFLLIMALVFVAIRLIEPITYALWAWLLDLIGQNDGVNSLGIDSLQREALVLRELLGQVGLIGRTLLFLWLGIIIPVVEEAFFRGLLYSALEERVGAWAALLLQAALYSLMHLDKVRFLYLLFLGVVFGFIVKKTSSVVPSLLLHVTVNVASLVAIVL